MILSIQRENWWCSLFSLLSSVLHHVVHFSNLQEIPLSKHSCIDNSISRGPFWLERFLRLNCPILRLALRFRLKLATTFEKHFLAFFDFSFWLYWTKCRCMRTHFFRPIIYFEHTYDVEYNSRTPATCLWLRIVQQSAINVVMMGREKMMVWLFWWSGSKNSGCVVHVNVTTKEIMWNDSYCNYFVIMIDMFFIWFPINIWVAGM